MTVDFTKPLRFKRVQDDNHATYRPRLVGSYYNDRNRLRWVVVLRYWDSAPSFIVYDEKGEPVDADQHRAATNATGIFDATLVNGDEIREVRGEVEGVPVELTLDGTKPVKVRIITP